MDALLRVSYVDAKCNRYDRLQGNKEFNWSWNLVGLDNSESSRDFHPFVRSSNEMLLREVTCNIIYLKLYYTFYSSLYFESDMVLIFKDRIQLHFARAHFKGPSDFIF